MSRWRVRESCVSEIKEVFEIVVLLALSIYWTGTEIERQFGGLPPDEEMLNIEELLIIKTIWGICKILQLPFALYLLGWLKLGFFWWQTSLREW